MQQVFDRRSQGPAPHTGAVYALQTLVDASGPPDDDDPPLDDPPSEEGPDSTAASDKFPDELPPSDASSVGGPLSKAPDDDPTPDDEAPLEDWAPEDEPPFEGPPLDDEPPKGLMMGAPDEGAAPPPPPVTTLTR